MISDRLKRISLLSRLTLASIWGAGKGAFAPHRCWVYFTKLVFYDEWLQSCQDVLKKCKIH